MLTFVVESGLWQFVDFATRGCNVLDIVLADDPLIISSVAAAPPLWKSDHLSIKFVLNVALENADSDSTDVYYNWYKADFDGMKCYLSAIDWQSRLYLSPSALTFWHRIVETLWSAVAMFVPVKSPLLPKLSTNVIRTFRSLCSLFLSRRRSEGWPHHGRTFSIYPCPLSF